MKLGDRRLDTIEPRDTFLDYEDDDVVYPFEEGDDYFTIEDGKVVWSCWDDTSEELYDPKKKYYATEEEAERALNQ